MRTIITLIFVLSLVTTTSAQSVAVESGAKEIIQPSQYLPGNFNRRPVDPRTYATGRYAY